MTFKSNQAKILQNSSENKSEDIIQNSIDGPTQGTNRKIIKVYMIKLLELRKIKEGGEGFELFPGAGLNFLQLDSTGHCAKQSVIWGSLNLSSQSWRRTEI